MNKTQCLLIKAAITHVTPNVSLSYTYIHTYIKTQKCLKKVEQLFPNILVFLYMEKRITFLKAAGLLSLFTRQHNFKHFVIIEKQL